MVVNCRFLLLLGRCFFSFISSAFIQSLGFSLVHSFSGLRRSGFASSLVLFAAGFVRKILHFS
jgi:hypothetical protein